MHISSSVMTTVSAYPNKRPLDASRTSHNTRITTTALKTRKLQADKAAHGAEAATNCGAKEATRGAEAARRKATVARKLRQTARLKGQHGGRRGGKKPRPIWRITITGRHGATGGAKLNGRDRRGDGGGKIFALCMIWGLRTKITPLGGKIFARCIP